MAIVSLQAYIDFTTSAPLADTARRIADACLGGLDFIGEDEGIWDEVPALRLNQTILGLEIILGGMPGKDGGYTLQISSAHPLGGDLPIDPEGSKAAICDFSTYVAALVQQIPGVEVSTPVPLPR